MNASCARFGAALAALILVAVGAGAQTAGATSGTLYVSSNTTLGEDHHGQIVVSADNVTLNCGGYAVLGPGPTGIWVNGRSHVTVRNCLVSGFGSGIILQQSPSSLVTGNTVTDNGGVGIGSYSLTGSTFSNNTASRNAMGFYVTPTGVAGQLSADNTLAGNTASGNSMYGFALIDLQDSDVVANTASDNAWDGFAAWSWKTGVFADTFVANRSDGNTRSGFSLPGVSSVTLSRNTATNNGVIGFWLSGATGNTLVGNTASGNALEGFEIVNAASSNVLERNTSSGNGSNGFEVLGYSTGNRLSGNIASGNLGFGFGSYGARGNAFVANRATGNTAGFALLYGSAQNSLVGNAAFANGIGFLVQRWSTGNTLTLNIGQNNTTFDAQDENPIGANSWRANSFAKTNPAELGGRTRY